MSLISDATIDQTQWVINAIKVMFGKELPEDITTDPSRGEVTVEGITFCMAEDKLRIIGVCPKCTMDVPSMPINRPADLADEKQNFRPMRHRCMDV